MNDEAGYTDYQAVISPSLHRLDAKIGFLTDLEADLDDVERLRDGARHDAAERSRRRVLRLGERAQRRVEPHHRLKLCT